jgi:predicted TIM-barrel fold metal-dependent hydrolase
MRLALDVLGPERIVFASDVPWGLNSGNGRLGSYPKLIRSLGLPDKVTDAIFADNILRIMRIT